MSTENTYHINIGSHDVEYALVRTSAPEAYDYGYVIPVPGIGDSDARFVLIPVESVDYQVSRYMSGMYHAERWTINGGIEDFLTRHLLNLLKGAEETV